MTLALLPQPKRLRFESGAFALPAAASIGISGQELYPVARMMAGIFRRAAVHIGLAGVRDTVTLRLQADLPPGGYRLKISTRGILIEAERAAGVFAGLQTLKQITAQAPKGRLAALTIDDWPDFADRGLYYDVTRGRVPRLERLMELADILAHYKINQLQLYIEHTFAFRAHPDIGRGASPLTAEDILKLDACCRERYIELVPSLASFGHLSTALNHARYRHMTEDWGIGKYVTPDLKKRAELEAWLKRGHEYAFTLSPANPESYTFLDSLFAEFLPLFSSRRFNACCDETYDLGYGQSCELCKKQGRGRLYLGHILKLNALCRKYGKHMMFWGDIIRHYPELIPQIPKDVTVLDWGYQYNHEFEKIRDFKKAGLKFYACPSTSSYVTLFPRLPQATANIAGFAAAARKYGARGLLNTEWGDNGHSNFMECSWHGFLFGAEQAWNVRAATTTFTDRFARLFLGSRDRSLARAIDELGEIAFLQMAGFQRILTQSVWRHIFFANRNNVYFYPPTPALLPSDSRDAWVCRRGIIRKTRLKLTAALGRQTLRRLDIIRAVLTRLAAQKNADPHKVLPYWLYAVDTLRHAARKLAVMAGRNTPAARADLKREMLALRRRFIRLWMARNRRSEIRQTLALFQGAIRAIDENRLFDTKKRD